jgi:hypothetical protein
LVNAALEHIDCVPLRIRNATAKDIAEGWASDAKEVYIWGGYSQKNGRLFYKPGVGDIIQFERCVFKKPDGTQSWSMPHHTAIVAYADGRKVVLLHQGLAGDGTVRQDYLDLDWLQKEGQFRGWSPSPFVIGGQASHLLRLTNEFRAQNKVAPVKLSDKLNLVAAKYAFVMAQMEKQGHGLDGKETKDRLKAAGYTFRLCWESVTTTPQKDDPANKGDPGQNAIDQFKNSKKGHREAMLNPEYTEMGAWSFSGRSGKLYYCQVFAKPR